MVSTEISFAVIIGCLGIAANAGILIFSRILGKAPSRTRHSLGGYSTDENASDPRVLRPGCIEAPAQRRVSESSASRFTTSNNKSTSLLSPISNISLSRLSSLLSINRLENGVPPCRRDFSNVQNQRICWRSQSRRHRVYLQGLLILASTNLLMAFALLVSATCSSQYPGTNSPVFQIIVATFFDTLQAVEISAILWIAVNRAHAIHSTSRRNSSGKKTFENRPSVAHTFQVTTERGASASVAGCCQCLCYFSRTIQQVASTTASPLHMDTLPPDKQTNTTCCTGMRFQKYSRLLICCLPFLTMFAAYCGSIYDWVEFITKDPHIYPCNPDEQIYPPIFYYTLPTSVGVFVGLFVMPMSFLLSTNCLIYRKVANRHKRFCNRQTSNTSKMTMLIEEEPVSSPTVLAGHRIARAKPSASSVPTFTITSSSSQDLGSLSPPLWDVPESSREHLPSSTPPLRKFATSTTPPPSTIFMLMSSESTGNIPATVPSFLTETTKKYQQHLTCVELPPRRNSTSALQKMAKPLNRSPARAPVDTIFVRQLQRQHKRTVVVLASILIFFVVCHGPRALTLCARWFLFEPESRNLLSLATLWSRLCTIVDPILYGFWGNRAYRKCLRNISAHLVPWRGTTTSAS